MLGALWAGRALGERARVRGRSAEGAVFPASRRCRAPPLAPARAGPALGAGECGQRPEGVPRRVPGRRAGEGAASWSPQLRTVCGLVFFVMLIELVDEVCQGRVRQFRIFQVVRKVLLYLSPRTASATGPLCFWGAQPARRSEQIHACQTLLR